MAKRDYYEVLGLSKGAGKDEIKKAYRTLVKEFHPDRNKAADAEAKFKEVQEAYEVLSNEEKKRAYDQYGHAGTQGFGGFGGFGGGDYSNYSGFEDLGDIFSQFFTGSNSGFGGFDFSGGGNRRRESRGEDLEMTVSITFTEAVFGTEKKLVYRRKVNCDSCHGTGAKDGTSFKKCATCGGSGYVRQVQHTFIGAIQTQSVCHDCHGTGQKIENECSNCSAKGYVDKDDEFSIKIPKGIPDGVTMKFAGRGNAGRHNGRSGDLYINIDVSPDDVLERRGDDIYMDEEIDVVVAVLGGEVEIPTVHGSVKMKIPEGTQPEHVFKLSGKGAPRFKGNGNGDQYVRIKVVVPTKLSREERENWGRLRSEVRS